jgi:N-acetylmuramoyl-L-alanine amidase
LAAHDDPPPVPAPATIDLTPVPDQAADWIPLEAWSNANHLGPARWLSSAGGIGCELRTPGGVFTVMAGSQIAHLDGVNCWLGYAPHFADSRLLVHALDARYNLLPLASRQYLPANADRVVVIDPGHGGENMGARSVADNRLEKQFTLDWALRLGPLLACEGWTVVLTRTNDVDVSLSDRVALADRMNADLFVSLHFNSSAHRDQAGLETYCLTPTGMPSTLTRDYEDDTTRVYPNNAFDTQNLQYAVRIHRSLLEATGGADRGVRRARFMGVLRGQNRPAVLLEGGYLSSPREARAIADPEFRRKLAEAVARALSLPNTTGQASITDSTGQSR